MTDRQNPISGEPVLSSELGEFPFEIPAPRSGKHYELWLAEVCDGLHGCLDAPID